MSKLRTHYDNLQVKENASSEVIKGAYRHLYLKWHPDRNPDNRQEAERVLKIINKAYSVLSDPTKRKEHDDWIARKRNSIDVIQNRHQSASHNLQQSKSDEFTMEAHEDFMRPVVGHPKIMSGNIGEHVAWIFDRIPWSATVVSFLVTFSLVRYFHGFPIQSPLSAYVVCASITIGCFYVYQNPNSPSIPFEPIEKFIPEVIGITLVTIIYFYLGFAASGGVLSLVSMVLDFHLFYRLSPVLLGALMLSPIFYMAMQRAKNHGI